LAFLWLNCEEISLIQLLMENIVKDVSIDQVFNLPLFETYLVIDCRSQPEYHANHIQSAFNFPPPPLGCNEGENQEALEKFIALVSASYVHENWDPVIVYGKDGDDVVTSHLLSLVTLLGKYIESHSTSLSTQTENSSESRFGARLSSFFEHLSLRTTNVWCLLGGFDAFEKKYPSLCVSSAICASRNVDLCGASVMVPHPHQISPLGDGVFIGSRAINWSTTFIREFRIQAMLIDQQCFERYSQSFTDCEVETLICAFPDYKPVALSGEEAARLRHLFDHSSTFIQRCVESNQRVVIQLHGRSHSAALVVAWLMRYRGMSLEEAKREVHSHTRTRPFSSASLIDNSLLFQEELIRWQGGQKAILFGEQPPIHFGAITQRQKERE
jgi:protein-tyrosine phosphatase